MARTGFEPGGHPRRQKAELRCQVVCCGKGAESRGLFLGSALWARLVTLDVFQAEMFWLKLQALANAAQHNAIGAFFVKATES